MDEKTIATDKARQGRRGSRVLMILIVGLALAAVAWLGLGIYGEAIDPTTPTAQTQN